MASLLPVGGARAFDTNFSTPRATQAAYPLCCRFSGDRVIRRARAPPEDRPDRDARRTPGDLVGVEPEHPIGPHASLVGVPDEAGVIFGAAAIDDRCRRQE
jgi:hypothetical protein